LLKLLDSFVARVTSVFAFLGATVIGLLALGIVGDVIGRQIGTPIVGIVEIAAQSVVLAAFLTMPYVMRRGSHIRATILVSRMPELARKLFEVFGYLIGITIFGLLAYSAYGNFMTDFIAGSFEGEGALRVPTWPTRLVIFLSATLMIIESVIAIVRTLTGVKK
jgi:TRAP-type C4-dicarboxylate transport system permease small subunit